MMGTLIAGEVFSVFSPITGKYGPGKTPYLDTFHTVNDQLSDLSQKNVLESFLLGACFCLKCRCCAKKMF